MELSKSKGITTIAQRRMITACRDCLRRSLMRAFRNFIRPGGFLGITGNRMD
jgi:hypothetical protein